MIYLDSLLTDEGLGVYFEIYSIEQRQEMTLVTGMVGDGYYEGGLLLEVGDRVELTFFDEWLGGDGLSAFFRRYGNESLRRSIVMASSELIDCYKTIPSRRSPAELEDAPLFQAA